MQNPAPLQTAHLFSIIDDKLMELLHSLTPEEWEAQTIARQWKVKDVAAHLLDGNIRALSLQRDMYFGTPGPTSFEFGDLVAWLNQFNHDWVHAARRISPSVMILLHEATGKPASEYFASLDPFEKSIFPVDWAGEKESRNWLHVAREYTEKWLHQQQIREAVNKPGIMTPELFRPFIHTFLFALPHTYRHTDAPEGTRVKLTIPADAGGTWAIERKGSNWILSEENISGADAELVIEADIAWKLFSKSLRPADVKDRVTVRGNRALGETALGMISVMA
jgi:uncharacterized protein (TIGR03083 family)